MEGVIACLKLCLQMARRRDLAPVEIGLATCKDIYLGPPYPRSNLLEFLVVEEIHIQPAYIAESNPYHSIWFVLWEGVAKILLFW